MERQEHLELAVDSNDAEAREEHRVVARWIKAFLGGTVPDLIDADRAEKEALAHPQKREYPDGGSDYVEASQHSDVPIEDEDDLVPISGNSGGVG